MFITKDKLEGLSLSKHVSNGNIPFLGGGMGLGCGGGGSGIEGFFSMVDMMGLGSGGGSTVVDFFSMVCLIGFGLSKEKNTHCY